MEAGRAFTARLDGFLTVARAFPMLEVYGAEFEYLAPQLATAFAEEEESGVEAMVRCANSRSHSRVVLTHLGSRI